MLVQITELFRSHPLNPAKSCYKMACISKPYPNCSLPNRQGGIPGHDFLGFANAQQNEITVGCHAKGLLEQGVQMSG